MAKCRSSEIVVMVKKVSVIIPVYNESETLEELIVALISQTRTPDEVIFIDAGSLDNSVDIIQKHIKDINVEFDICLLINNGGLPGANRNRGLSAAKGEWVAFLDAGIIPRNDWLENLINCVTSKKLNAAFGLCRFDSSVPFQKSICAISNGCGTSQPVLPASLFYRSIFEVVGVFREDLRAAEDILWIRNYERAFGTVPVCTNAVVFYSHFPNNYAQLIKKWWLYEKNSIDANVVTYKQKLISFIFFIFLIWLITYSSIGMMVFFIFIVIIRGVVVPALRSYSWIWWRNSPSSFITAIVACFVRDATKLVCRAYFLLN